MTTTKGIGIFGGTFDPIHLGHIHVAQHAYQQLGLAKIIFIPCFQSPFKELPIASSEERIAMIKLAIKDYPYFLVDEREIIRAGISYTVDTLTSLRKSCHDPLCLLMSMDAFTKFNYWHEWQQILQLSHLIVANRPGIKIDNPIVLDLLKEKQIFSASNLQDSKSGSIFLLDIPPNPISATEIRNSIKQGQDVSNFLNPSVWEFIKQHKIYLTI